MCLCGAGIMMVVVPRISFFVGLLLLFSRGPNNPKWIAAPITYISRPCLSVPYEVLSSRLKIDDTKAAAAASTSAAVDSFEASTKICIITANATTTGKTGPLQKSLSHPLFQPHVSKVDVVGSSSFIEDLTWPNKLDYAKKHGYRLLSWDGSSNSRNISSRMVVEANEDASRRPPEAWSKLKAVESVLLKQQPEQQQHHHDSLCDWVAWMDADTIVMNSDIRIIDLLPADPHKHLVVGPDKGGEMGFSSGVFFFRSTAWSLQTLDTWWNMKTDFTGRHFMSSSSTSSEDDVNRALTFLLKNSISAEEFEQHVAVTPSRCNLNSVATCLTLSQSRNALNHLADQSWYLDDEHYHSGDFIAHTSGIVSNTNKIACLQLLLPDAH